MTFDAALVWKILLKKYPDGVDIQVVHQKNVIETTLDYGAGGTPYAVETIVELREIEPETGIYSAMSEKTHRIYLYVDTQEVI